MKEQIAELLMTHFSITLLRVVDESHLHSGHAAMKGIKVTSGTHVAITMIAAEFQGHSPVACHRMVYGLLKPFFSEGLHAAKMNLRKS